MKRTFLFISIIILSFLSAGFTVPERLTIVELNTETLTVGNRELKVGGSFSSDQTIYWKSSKQAAEVQDNIGQLYIFTKEAFEQKNVKTPKEYLLSGKFSTRPAYDSPKIGRNKTSFPEKRVAMVIGNSNYISKADFLRAPIADAGMISEKLVDLGFDTYTICDASSSDLFKAVAKFSEASSKYDIALFYYAGHGFCYNHENYYQPVDISDINYDSVHRCLKASELMKELSDKAKKGTILVMDACRSMAKVRGDEIFAPMEARPGMMIFCSTSDGKAAIDAIGEYSPFAKAFAEKIAQEGLSVNEIARSIRNDVRKLTSGIQIPTYSEVLYEDFYFHPQVKKEGTTPVARQTTTSSISNPTPTKPTTTQSTPTQPALTTNYTQEYVDLGLSVKWASCNLGATKPEEYGDCFAWGELETHYWQIVENYINWKSNLEGGYDWCTYKWCNYKSPYEERSIVKYNYQTKFGVVDNIKLLDKGDDAAFFLSNGECRIPTANEWKELMKKCTWEFTELNGVIGFKISGKRHGYTNNWIFLPFSRFILDDSILSSDENKYIGGEYWSSSLYIRESTCAFVAQLSKYKPFTFMSYRGRSGGLPIRPVSD